MAKNQNSSTGEGRHQTLAIDGVLSGDMVLVEEDGLHGVALIDTNAQGNVVIDIAGRWYLPVESGATINFGDALYCDATGGTLDNDPDHGIFFGYALESVVTAPTGTTLCVLVVQDHVLQDGEVLTAMIADGAITTSKIGNGQVTAAKWANGAGVAALLTAGLGASAAYTKDSNGPIDLLAAGIGVNAVILVAIVTQAFADGTGTQTTFAIGDESTANKFFATTVFTNATLGQIFISAGNTASAEKVVTTAVKATGTGTGAIAVTVIGLPTA